MTQQTDIESNASTKDQEASPAAGAETTPEVNKDAPLDLLAEVAKWKDLAARNQAEMENYRKRVIREREDEVKRAQSRIIEELLPLFDNFEFGMMEVRKGDQKSPIAVGMVMIERQLKEFMASVGVEVIDATGQPFDPNLHEAVGQEESAEVAEGRVLKQMRRGFKLRDRLLRPAMVVVSKGAVEAKS